MTALRGCLADAEPKSSVGLTLTNTTDNIIRTSTLFLHIIMSPALLKIRQKGSSTTCRRYH
uniref:Uncharacterized protein n=1 Tax=Lotus japonicus TaxID=34305 RepID=I3SAA4_LOTJA|nr:unknown [Lotus japonicus]